MAVFQVTRLGDAGEDGTAGADLGADAADGGGLSLREVIHHASLTAGADGIGFDAGLGGGVIRLQQGELTVTDALTIDAGALGITRRSVPERALGIRPAMRQPAPIASSIDGSGPAPRSARYPGRPHIPSLPPPASQRRRDC